MTDAEQRIIDAWRRNGTPWIKAIDNGEIESRVRVTNQAITSVVLSRKPRSVLDIGCGEGWLARELMRHGIAVHGIDADPDLIQRARVAGGGRFNVVSHEMLARGALGERFDVCVCNFSLLGKDSVDDLVAVVSRFLEPAGALIVQTLHPLMACGDLPYADGWREGSWAGFSAEFTDAPPWYFRRLETWVSMFDAAGLRLVALHEPIHPVTGKPASLILVGERQAMAEPSPPTAGGHADV